MAMRVAVITSEQADSSALLKALDAVDGVDIDEARARDLASVLRPAPRVAVLCLRTDVELASLPREVRRLAPCPIMAIVPPALSAAAGSSAVVDDFAVEGATRDELRARVRRLARTSPAGGETIQRGDLLIDTSTCEVSLRGALVELTFKEYELLKYLALHPGRVLSRDALLSSVWGYDYYGGDRTVDVHVRRLRSKIEDADHTFIDTVRNMGYRFRRDELRQAGPCNTTETAP